ncbi:MAG TPA: DciA family protein [Xanthobacteraceae bacterium]|nr:DciA family protein [Xanthobacteraceae bacterium]
MSKRSHPKPLADLVRACVAGVFARQGFTSCEIVTHWDDIVGSEIATLAEPIRMQWVRSRDPDESPPATLVLRVEGPAAIEIQHISAVIVERVNRHLGWQAVGRLALRQAPLTRRGKPPRPKIDENAAAAIAEQMTGVVDEGLRAALGRLGAAIKRT